MNGACAMSMLRASVVAKRFQEKVAMYWTPERIKHLTGGKDMPLALDKPGVPTLLRVLGVLDGEGKLTNINKYKQVNSMVAAAEPRWIRLFGAAKSRCASSSKTGKSTLALALALVSEPRWRRPAHVLAVDRDQTRMTKAVQHARSLGLDGSSSMTSSSVKYRLTAVEELGHIGTEYAAAWPEAYDAPASAPHAVLALHACDTATDDALAAALRAQANIVMVAPCCQAELAAKWARGERSEGSAAFAPIPCGSLRRDMAATTTDAMRMALLRASATPSAPPILCRPSTRRKQADRRYRPPPGQDTHEKRDTALREYERLAAATGARASARAAAAVVILERETKILIQQKSP